MKCFCLSRDELRAAIRSERSCSISGLRRPRCDGSRDTSLSTCASSRKMLETVPVPRCGVRPSNKKQTNKQIRGGRRNIEISDGCCHGDARERQPSRNRCLGHMSSQFLSLFFRRVRVLFLLVFFWFSLLVLFVCLFLLLLLLLLLMRDRRNRRTFVSAA